ncbi:MAG: hypothetical protein ABIG11_11030, partial [bacterium]
AAGAVRQGNSLLSGDSASERVLVFFNARAKEYGVAIKDHEIWHAGTAGIPGLGLLNERARNSLLDIISGASPDESDFALAETLAGRLSNTDAVRQNRFFIGSGGGRHKLTPAGFKTLVEKLGLENYENSEAGIPAASVSEEVGLPDVLLAMSESGGPDSGRFFDGSARHSQPVRGDWVYSGRTGDAISSAFLPPAGQRRSALTVNIPKLYEDSRRPAGNAEYGITGAAGPLQAEKPAQVVPSMEVAWARLRYSKAGMAIESAAGAVRGLVSRLWPGKPGKVLLYAGQFDPFHPGHRAEFLGALSAENFDHALVAPSMGLPGLPTGDRAPAWLRLFIAQKNLPDDSRSRVDSTILRQRVQGAAAITDTYRKKLGPAAEITFLMGSDNYRDISQWAGIERLLTGANLLVNVRPDYPVGDKPLEFLPEPFRKRYRLTSPGTYTDTETGRTLKFIRVPGPSVSSREVVQAVRNKEWRKLEKLMDAGSAGLVSSWYYPDIDWDDYQRNFIFRQDSRPLFQRAFGAETAENLLNEPGLLQRLARIDAKAPDAAVSIVREIYRAARDGKTGLASSPYLYSRALSLAIDPDFLRILPGTAPPQEDAAQNAVKKEHQSRHPSFMTRIQKALERPVGRLQGATMGLQILSDAPDPGHYFHDDRTLRVYMGIDAGLNEADIRIRGFLSRYALNHGEDAVERSIAGTGLRRLMLEHLRGRYSESKFVATTLDSRVAERFAGPGGTILTADIPLRDAFFANDPQIWSGTAFHSSGNPNDYLHEVVMLKIRPEWIVDMRQARNQSWAPSRSERLRTYVELITRPLTGRIAKLLGHVPKPQ